MQLHLVSIAFCTAAHELSQPLAAVLLNAAADDIVSTHVASMLGELAECVQVRQPLPSSVLHKQCS